MADINLTVQDVVFAGVDPTDNALAIANVYHVPNDGRVFLHFRKTGVGACTVTFDVPRNTTPYTQRRASWALSTADPTLVVPATTGDVVAGPYPPETFNDASGNLLFSVSEATGLTCTVLRYKAASEA